MIDNEDIALLAIIDKYGVPISQWAWWHQALLPPANEVCPRGECLTRNTPSDHVHPPGTRYTHPRSRHPTSPGADTPLGADPLEQTPPPPRAASPGSRHPPGADTPQSRHPLGVDTPRSRHPPEADTPPEQTPPQSRPPREQTYSLTIEFVLKKVCLEVHTWLWVSLNIKTAVKASFTHTTNVTIFTTVYKCVQYSLMMPFTWNVKKIKHVAHKNGDVDVTCKRALKTLVQTK